MFVWLLAALLTIWMDSLLNSLFVNLNKNVVEKSTKLLPKLTIDLLRVAKHEIPVYLIALFFATTWLLLKFYNFIILRRRKLKILKAEYGSGTTFVDVTTQLNNFVVNDKISIPLRNSIVGVDPTPGTVKVAKIRYEINGKEHKSQVVEQEMINLP